MNGALPGRPSTPTGSFTFYVRGLCFLLPWRVYRRAGCTGPLAVLVLGTCALRSVDQLFGDISEPCIEFWDRFLLNTSASVPCKWALALSYTNYWAYVRKCLFLYRQMLKMPRPSAGAEVGRFWLLAVVLMAWTRLERVTEILWLSR